MISNHENNFIISIFVLQSVSDSDDDDVYLTPPETMSPNSPDDMPSEEPIYSNYTMGYVICF